MSYRIYALIASLAIASIYSCKKNDNKKDPDPSARKVLITLNYPSDSYSDVELILSESAGKILLDTIAPTNTDIVAELSTDETLMDVTYILGESATAFYVYTYKAVNPATWKIGYPSVSFAVPTPGTPKRTTITYTNVPPNSYNTQPEYFRPYLFNSYINGFSNPAPVAGNSINVEYDLYPGQFAYLLLPKAGLYKITTPAAGGETVDLTNMDNAVRLNLNTPNYIDSTICELYGFLDKNDYSKAYMLFNSSYKSDLADILYPASPIFQKYITAVTARDVQRLRYYFSYVFSDTIVKSPEFFKPEDWQIVSRSPENFTISFPNTKPSYYEATYVTPNGTYYTPKISWTITANPDSSTIHPMAMLSRLKGIKMKDEALDALALYYWDIYRANDLNYADYFKMATDPANHPFSSLVKLENVHGLYGDKSRIGDKGLMEMSAKFLHPFNPKSLTR